MGLREQAIEAAEAAREQRAAAARTVLASTLTPADVSALEVAAQTPELVVFTDGADLFLAVGDRTSPPRLSLVTNQGGWTRRGDVDSLTTLGRLLAAAEGDA
ncbi:MULTISPECIES: hypothetical protein [unclassified Nocardioides]|uniref:hypothetical protein n=1 Tax=unclassified Nocardioides TaxID=2615069 RepID=UPI0009F08144|nr:MULTISPECIES: hypothetical protein [unclassified Nocardioides]GAW50622.1 Pyridoxamine kinase [Nocardioides sp. PD653-B2]GAW55521.1 Pyridoxamine kinase [Nocardioides sp. PD653]